MRQITDLKSILTSDPIEAVEFYERTVLEDNDGAIQEASKIMANYLRNSSVFKRNLIISKLQRSSMLSRFHLSLQFHGVKETMFPKNRVFGAKRATGLELSELPHRRHHVTAVGTNRYFNLGVISDGSPVEEPHLVCIPPVSRIEMTNTHTVFLTTDNRLWGCGKAASFLPDRIEESEGGYVALPTEICIPKVTGRVRDIHVEEGGTQFLIGEKWYFVGKPPNSKQSKRISSNCVESEDKEYNPTVHFQKSNVQLNGSSAKIFVQLENGQLYWDRSPQFPAKKEIDLIVNGFPANITLFHHFQVLEDGSIYLANNELFKGKLEFWKNKDDGFVVKNGTEMEHFDTKYTLLALLEEVPGSIGTELFKVSPDGNNLIVKMGYRNPIGTRPHHYHSLFPHLILEEREEQGDFVEIPLDLKFCFHELDGGLAEHQMNRKTFELMFPELAEHIINGEVHFLPFLNRSNLRDDLRKYAFEMNLDQPRERAEGSGFTGNGSDDDDIWWLLSNDGAKVACHKYPLLLHSRQVGAMQRFNSTIYGATDFRNEPVEIETHSSQSTIRNALRGMLNPVSLFGIKTIELIECINFYDYLLMDELFDDAFHILLETTNDFSLPFLFELFYSFEEQVVEGLVERPWLLFNSISTVFPPKKLILKFCERLEASGAARAACRENLTAYLQNYESEDVTRYFLNLEEDSEDVVWRSLKNEYEIELPGAMEHAKSHSSRKLRSRTSSTKEHKTAPILIPREKTESFSHSVSVSPSITKPIPIGGAPRASLDDFPEMSPSSLPTPSKGKSPGGGRFVPKGTRFVNANQILKPAAPHNPWKPVERIQEELRFDDVVQKEQILQRNIRTGFKKVQLLPHVETEELAGAQILEVFRRELQDEALICVELVLTDDLEVENEQIVWGNMPGLVRR